MEHKYKHEIHANELVLLAYYIAAVNIETVYHELRYGSLSTNAPYEPFEGILLTDTFQMYEQERDMVANLLPDNSERRTKQKALDIRVIIGNPPYSAGQESANDNAANIVYPLGCSHPRHLRRQTRRRPILKNRSMTAIFAPSVGQASGSAMQASWPS